MSIAFVAQKNASPPVSALPVNAGSSETMSNAVSKAGSSYFGPGALRPLPPVAPQLGIKFQAASPPYEWKSVDQEMSVRATLPKPMRPLPPANGVDKPGSTLGHKLDALAAPSHAQLSGLPALMSAATHVLGTAGDIIQSTGPVGSLFQNVMTNTTLSLLNSPLPAIGASIVSPLLGVGLGAAEMIVGSKNLEGMVREALNFFSSEKGGNSLSIPAVASMAHQKGAGWKGALDGLVNQNGGLNWYSAFFLGNLKNRTGGGDGPNVYKNLVIDTWDQKNAGRSFLTSVGHSAISRPDTAGKWYAEYYYDVLDQEDGSGIATKVADTLDNRFGVDAGVLNAIYPEGMGRWSAYARANPSTAADLAGDPSIVANRAKADANGLSGPQISGVTSTTRAYANAPSLNSPLGGLAQTLMGTAEAGIFGAAVAAAAALFGEKGTGKIANWAFDNVFSGSNIGLGSLVSGLAHGAEMTPMGKQALTSLVKGVLSSSAGTAWTITSSEEFPQDPKGLAMMQQIYQPLLQKHSDGKSILDNVLAGAHSDPALANNLRAVVDELGESKVGQMLTNSLGMQSFIAQVKTEIPTASIPASMVEGSQAVFPLTNPDNLNRFLQNTLSDAQPIMDSNGDLTKFARIGLRLWGHDILDGGHGSVFLRTLLNPIGSGNQDLLANSDMVKKWGQMDLADDGKINGSVFKSLNSQILDTLGGNGAQALKDFTATPTSLDVKSLAQDVPPIFDMATQKVNVANFNALAKQLDVTPNDLGDLMLWGHVAAELPADKRKQALSFDTAMTQLLAPKTVSRTFDNVFALQVPGLGDHYRSWIGNYPAFIKHIGQIINKVGS